MGAGRLHPGEGAVPLDQGEGAVPLDQGEGVGLVQLWVELEEGVGPAL